MPLASPARARRLSRRAATRAAIVAMVLAWTFSPREGAAHTAPAWLTGWMRAVAGRGATGLPAADTTTVYGPRVLSLGNATSATFVEKFAIANPQGGYLLRVTNSTAGASTGALLHQRPHASLHECPDVVAEWLHVREPLRQCCAVDDAEG